MFARRWRNADHEREFIGGEGMIRQRLYEAVMMANTFGVSLDYLASDLDRDLKIREGAE